MQVQDLPELVRGRGGMRGGRWLEQSRARRVNLPKAARIVGFDLPLLIVTLSRCTALQIRLLTQLGGLKQWLLRDETLMLRRERGKPHLAPLIGSATPADCCSRRAQRPALHLPWPLHSPDCCCCCRPASNSLRRSSSGSERYAKTTSAAGLLSASSCSQQTSEPHESLAATLSR